MSKKSFYCWYLGFTEAYGLQGHNRIYELVNNIIKYQSEKNAPMNMNNHGNKVLPNTSKVTLKLSETSLTILDTVPNSSNQKRSNSSRKASFLNHQSYSNKNYTINYENITYVARLISQPFSDIVIFIVKSNLNATSVTELNKASLRTTFNMHAFRCDSIESAIKMEQYLNYFRKAYWKRFDKQKAKHQKSFLASNSSKENSHKHFMSGHFHHGNNVNSDTSNNSHYMRSSSPPQNDHLINNKVFLQNHLFRVSASRNNDDSVLFG
jgi:hypothetical protein